MSKIEPLVIQLKFKDAGSQAVIDKVKNSLKQLDIAAKGARPRIMGLRKEILAQGQASIKSVSNINAQRSALQALRDEAKIGGKAFVKLTADIKKLDAQMAKGGGAAPKRGAGARRATQTAGAIISGGIFGGPEGAIGGALGAFGGVEGAFAGAAIGAQVGMIRQAVGDMADYAASIEKLKIALNGVLPNQNDFNFAIQAAQLATKELNIPQEQSIRGITRLSAAVTGAGGPVRDATSVFRNVTAAIKATGGSSQDVQGAITAMVQVFSKGKVSAEELSSQLGERLPGAVTMFAKANKMTLPELQKNLKAGTVGLNELMNFIHELGVTFEGTARQISDSNADAGARLSVAIADMQADVGAALIPIGAQFQAAFADFIRKITPFLVEFLPKIGNLFLELAKRIDSFAVAAIAGFAVFGAAKLAAIVVSIGGIGAALLKLKGIMVGISLVNPYTALFAGATALGLAINENIRQQRAFNILVREGSVAEVEAALKSKGLELDEKILVRIDAERIAGGRENMDVFLRDAVDAPVNELKKEIEELKERRRTAIIDRDQGAAIPANLLKRFEYDPVKPDGSDGDSGTGKKDNTQRLLQSATALVTKQRETLSILRAQNEVEKLLNKQANERAALELDFANLKKRARSEEAVEEIESQRILAVGLQRRKQELEVQKQGTEELKKIMKPIDDLNKKIKDKINFDKEYNRLISEGINPELAKQLIAIKEQFEVTKLLLDAKIAERQAAIDSATAEERKTDAYEAQLIALEDLKRQREGLPTLQEDAEGSAGKAYADPSFMDTLGEKMKALYDEATNLNEQIANVGVKAVGDFADAFVELAMTGKSSFKELTVSILQDLSRIIMRAAVLQAFKALVPGLFAADGAVTKGIAPAANGLAVGRNGIVPYAKGGLVTKPTLFQYQQGGVGNYGLMGEAGTEAIMPLRRGRNGKLGVEASGGGVGNVVVNVNASGSNVQGNGPDAKALGNAIGAAVQAELIKQKRPGGLLS